MEIFQWERSNHAAQCIVWTLPVKNGLIVNDDLEKYLKVVIDCKLLDSCIHCRLREYYISVGDTFYH